MTIHVAIADDHAVLRAGLRMLINAQPDMEVIGEAADGIEAVEMARKTQPDVILLDIGMPGHGGLQAIAKIRQVSPPTRVLVLTMHDDPAYLQFVLAEGGAGYVVKSAADTELLEAIRAVANGRLFVNVSLDESVTKNAVEQKAAGEQVKPELPPPTLSDREREVLELIAKGHTNREVADKLALSVKTVEAYRARLMDKLSLRTRAELVRYALEHGLLSPDKTS